MAVQKGPVAAAVDYDTLPVFTCYLAVAPRNTGYLAAKVEPALTVRGMRTEHQRRPADGRGRIVMQHVRRLRARVSVGELDADAGLVGRAGGSSVAPDARWPGL